MRKLIEVEKKNNFAIRTVYSKEMESKKELEGALRGFIEDVRDEINKKKNETAFIYKQHHHNKVMAKLTNRLPAIPN